MIETIINLISSIAQGIIYGTVIFGIVVLLLSFIGHSKFQKIVFLILGIVIYVSCMVIAYLELNGIFIFK